MEEPPTQYRAEVLRGTSPTPPLGARNLVFDVANWHPKPVKRPRPVKSCTECRRRKLRCDRRCPCSQCQRSYRVCMYGSGGNGSGGSSNKGTDPSNPNADSEGSDASDDDEDLIPGGAAGERPPKRHLSRPGTGSTPQAAADGSHPPFNSSLSLLLNPSSPATQTSAPPAAGHAQAHALLPPSAASAAPAPFSIPTSIPALAQISSTLENPEPLMSLSGRDLREFTASLILEFTARMERLEKLVLAKDASALSAIPPFPSSSTLSQLHLRQQPQDPRQRVIDASSTTMRAISAKGPQGWRTRYFGQNCTRVLLNLFDDAKDFMCDQDKRGSAGDLFWRLERIYAALQEDHQQTLKPITVYVDSMMPVQKRMADILPRRDVCERLLDAYVDVSEGLYRVIHVPTFRKEFEAYWVNGVNGSTGNGSTGNGSTDGFHRASGPNGVGAATGVPQGVSEDFLPRLLCILCIGSRFEADSKGLAYDRSDGVHIPTACALVRSWLDTLRGKQSVDVITLQTEVLHLHASRMISPRSQRVWTELGMITRMAMAMGLHRDPAEITPQVSPFIAECRRKLWFTIMDMDLHVALASGLPSALRPGIYTCQPPRNLDDTDICPETSALPSPKPMDQYTEGQMQRFAADTLPLRMRASDLLCHIDSLTDYGEVLAVGGELEKALDDINCLFPRNAALGSHHKHKEWRMRAMLDMHIRRPLLALYRPFALSASAEFPPPTAISDIYLKSSMAMLTYMKELDPTIPGFNDVSHMYYVILRNDIVQAAFSVCYYIMQAVEAEASDFAVPESNGSTGPNVTSNGDGGGAKHFSGGAKQANGGSPSATQGPTTKAGSTHAPGTASHVGSNGTAARNGRKKPRKASLIWSSAYLIRTVERTVENLARLVNDLSFDLRDVIALATVLGSVMPASGQAQRNEHIREQVGRVLDTCVEKLRGNTSPAVRVAVMGQDLPPSLHASDWYSRPQLIPNDKPAQPDEPPRSDTDFWDHWDHWAAKIT